MPSPTIHSGKGVWNPGLGCWSHLSRSEHFWMGPVLTSGLQVLTAPFENAIKFVAKGFLNFAKHGAEGFSLTSSCFLIRKGQVVLFSVCSIKNRLGLKK